MQVHQLGIAKIISIFVLCRTIKYLEKLLVILNGRSVVDSHSDSEVLFPGPAPQ